MHDVKAFVPRPASVPMHIGHKNHRHIGPVAVSSP